MADFVFDRDAVRAAMKNRAASQQALADAIGLTHKSAVAKILSGERQVKVQEASRIYEFLNLVPIEHRSTKVIPLIGFTSAGSWREAINEPRGRMIIPEHVAGSKAFAVEVEGTSMNRVIRDGSWIVVDPDKKALTAKCIYLIQNGDYEVTVKRYMTNPERFEPDSDDPEHTPFLMSDCDFKVLGRVVYQGGPL